MITTKDTIDAVITINALITNHDTRNAVIITQDTINNVITTIETRDYIFIA